MTWFKLDDKSSFHSKVVAAGNEAWGALCRAGAWSSGECTDGLIPEPIALMIAPKKIWNRLENCGGAGRNGLVFRTDLGWQIHDFNHWNPEGSIVKASQQAKHIQAQKAAAARWQKRSEHAGSMAAPDARSNAVSIAQRIADGNASADAMRARDPDPSRPVPSDPDLSPKPSPKEHEPCQVGVEPNLTALSPAQANLPRVPDAPATAAVKPDSVAQVFEYWRAKLMPGAKLDDKRRKVIKRALKTYTVEELCKAVDGTAIDPHRMGNNDRGRKYVDCDLVFRDADHIDPMIAAAEAVEQRRADSEPSFEFDQDPDDPDPPGEPEPISDERIRGLIAAATGGLA